MTDIGSAIQAEKEYLALRRQGEEANLAEKLQLYGFSLSSYFEEKRDYLLRHMDYQSHIIYDESEALPIMEDALVNKKNVYIPLKDSSECFIWHGSDPIDTAKCNELDIAIINLGYTGGNIVTGKDDFNCAIVVADDIDMSGNYFLKRFYKFIAVQNPSAVLDNNDILIDGKKIAGSMTREENGVHLFSIQISLVDHSQIVAELGLTNPDKPVGILRGITKDELFSEVESWL